MPQHSYKQLEKAYQKGVNKEHEPNPARTHPMSSQQGKGCLEMPVNQSEPAQYSQDSQSDSDHDFEVTTVKPTAESTRLDSIHSHPQDSHAPCHMRQRTDDMDKHGHQGAPGDQQGPYTGHGQAQPASQKDEIRHLRGGPSTEGCTEHVHDIRELVAGIRDLSSTLIHNNSSSMNTTLNNSNQRHQLSISVLNDINTFDGKQGHKLDDWLADIENAATLVEENEVIVAKGKARGLVRDLIKEHEDKPWPHIKEQLHNHLNNASIHTYTSRFMEIQQKDSEMLTAYIHRFKKEAKHCNFDSHPAKIRIFLKGLIHSSKIALGVYKKGPETIEDAISIVEKISSAQCIAASFSQNHQISMMKRGSTDRHTPSQDCSNCGQLGHSWFTCPHIICDGCNQHGHIYNIVGIEYHLQEQLVHPKAVITENDYHAPNTPEIDVMTQEAVADLMLGLTQETEVQAAQDTPAWTETPAGTETLHKGIHPIAAELKADHLIGSAQVAIDHRPLP